MSPLNPGSPRTRSRSETVSAAQTHGPWSPATRQTRTFPTSHPRRTWHHPGRARRHNSLRSRPRNRQLPAGRHHPPGQLPLRARRRSDLPPTRSRSALDVAYHRGRPTRPSLYTGHRLACPDNTANAVFDRWSKTGSGRGSEIVPDAVQEVAEEVPQRRGVRPPRLFVTRRCVTEMLRGIGDCSLKGSDHARYPWRTLQR